MGVPGEGVGLGDCGVGFEGSSSPATNITGASCARSSGGYEFMVEVDAIPRRDWIATGRDCIGVFVAQGVASADRQR